MDSASSSSNKLFFLPRTYGLTHIEDFRKKYYPDVEQKDILYFFDFDQTVSDSNDRTGMPRGGQATIDFFNKLTADGIRWYINTAKKIGELPTVFNNMRSRHIPFSQPVVADARFVEFPNTSQDVTRVNVPNLDGRTTVLGYTNNVLTAEFEKWLVIQFVLENLERQGKERPKLIILTDDSALNILLCFKPLSRQLYKGVDFMGVIYEPPVGVEKEGLYAESIKEIKEMPDVQLIYPDGYVPTHEEEAVTPEAPVVKVERKVGKLNSSVGSMFQFRPRPPPPPPGEESSGGKKKRSRKKRRKSSKTKRRRRGRKTKRR